MRIKIYTLTLNPTLDLSGYVDGIVLDEKNKVTNSKIDPGGNGINSARICKRLGADPIVLGFAGGSTGDLLKSLLKKEGVRSRFTRIQDSTRINVTVSDAGTHHQTRLSFPGPVIKGLERKALLREIDRLPKSSLLLIGGSRPRNIPVSFLTKILKMTSRKKISVILDLPADDLSAVLKIRFPHVILIKPNLFEFSQMTHLKKQTEDQLLRSAKALLSRTQVCCISLGKKGALVARDQDQFHIAPPEVKALGSVGAGDSLVGGFAASLAQLSETDPANLTTEQFLNVMKTAIAAGAATASTPGTALGSKVKIRELSKKVKFRRI